MWTRKKFLQQTALTAGAFLAPRFTEAEERTTQRLTLLHTNDTHSRLEPFPMDGSRNQGLGGVAARAKLIQEIREQEEQVLLLDAGDIFQGTPYFNVYKGEPEIKAMQQMGYDACTMGNHDFDGGLDNFANQLQHARFPVVLCNYDFSNTPMEHKYMPYKILKKGNLKVGVTGVGIELKGLVPDNLAGNTQYLQPVQRLNEVADTLKRRKGCDFVICLSHLGYQYRDNPNRMSDLILAKESELVDVIIGGHTHTFLNDPLLVKNKINSDVVINQVGWGGIILGRMDFEFSPGNKKNLMKSHSVVVGKKSSE